ncbi:MAG: GntR family transcriptional regulator, partial [Planctomycetota bacterium]
MVVKRPIDSALVIPESESNSSKNGTGTKPRKIRKSEMVVASIREYIISNKLRSGDSLPTEGELAEQLGVSRVSVREATQALAFM